MIYCVEDDNGIRDLMTYTLAVSGYEAKGFPDSAGLWEALHTVRPELLASALLRSPCCTWRR